MYVCLLSQAVRLQPTYDVFVAGCTVMSSKDVYVLLG